MDFIDKDHSVVHNATYTTCQRDDEASWQPSWMLKAETIELDMAEEVGVAHNAKLQFKGVTVLPVPRMSFPLSDKRKSGLLPPMIGMDKLGGIEYSQPYYWNIAPNRDLTVTPTLMTKRGVNLTGLFRYMEPSYSGETYASYMPGDNLRSRDRWGYSWQHRAMIDSPLGGLGLNLNLNRVSDDDYWRDFRLAPVAMRQRLLPSTASLSWAKGDGALSLNMTRYQTLQDPDALIAPPYSMVPQLQYRYTPQELPHGLDFSLVADTTRFELIRPLTGQAVNNGQRSYVQAQLSRPFLSPGAFITPKLMLHTSRYDTDSMMSNGSKSANRTLPTFSLDSGLVLSAILPGLARSCCRLSSRVPSTPIRPIAIRACCRCMTPVAATSISRVFFRERLCRPGPYCRQSPGDAGCHIALYRSGKRGGKAQAGHCPARAPFGPARAAAR